MSQEHCSFCGLPVSAARGTVAERTPQPIYCCFGCEFAAEVTRCTGREGLNRALMLRVATAAFCTMNVLAFTMVLWSHDIYVDQMDDRVRVLDDVLRYLGLLFSLPVWFLLGQPLLTSAIGGLQRHELSTDFLVCLGVLAAYSFSVSSTVRGGGAVYYEVACVVLVLMTLGRWLESRGKLQASAALNELERLLPDNLRLIVDEHETFVPAGQVIIGNTLETHPGECIGVDGIVLNGNCHVDERLLTGESWPVDKRPGDTVRAGSFNVDGCLRIKATSTAEGGSLGRLIRSVHSSRHNRGRYQQLAERITSWFLPLVLLIAIATLVGHSWLHGIENGVLTALSVLLIACPCAIGLATPLAAWTAFGYAAKQQVLFRDCEALERLSAIRAIAWDKTGTLTTSLAAINSVVWASEADPSELLPGIASLAAVSHHPYSRAIAKLYELAILDCNSLVQIHERPGRGIVGDLATGQSVCLGNLRLAEELHLAWPPRLSAALHQLEQEGRPIVISGWNGTVQALFVVSESLRPGAEDSVDRLQQSGIHQQVLTGDHAVRTRLLLEELFARRIQPPSTAYLTTSQTRRKGTFTFSAALSPEEKALAIDNLRSKYGPVAMIGDGVNDAAALSSADVGISLRSSADISRDSSGVCLLREDLRLIPWAISYSRFAVRVIRQNLFWSFAYNSVGIGIATAGYLSPTLAAALMVGSSAFVIANSYRLSRGLAPASTPPVVPDTSDVSDGAGRSLSTHPEATKIVSDRNAAAATV